MRRIAHCRVYTNWKLYACVVLLFFSVLVLLVKFYAERSYDEVPELQSYRLFPPLNAAKYCFPKSNLVFLKTHKCASSTVQNILLRYGDMNDLNFVLPASGHYLGNQISFNRFMVEGTPWHHLGYNMFVHHTIFNESEIRAIMPPDSNFVSIIRDPVDLFESLYSFSNFQMVYHKDIEQFARWKKPFGNKSSRVAGHLGRNQMLFDLGYDANQFENETAVKSYIRELDRIFDLILVAERFDESLILFKDFMCWDLDDVVYFRHNARTSGHKNFLSAEAQHELRRYNMADQMLYDYFAAKLDKMVERFGRQKMAREVEALQKRSQEWFSMCVAKAAEANTLKGSAKTWSNQVLGFQIRNNMKNSTCFRLVKAEIPYTKFLRHKQMNHVIQKTRGKNEVQLRKDIIFMKSWRNRRELPLRNG